MLKSKLKKIAIIFLTHNSETNIHNSIKSAQKISNDIYVVDSFSKDTTTLIGKELGCKIFKRKFINYSDQRNWIIRKLNKKYLWQLHLDADEVVDKELVKSINQVINKKKSKKKTFLIKKKYYFFKKKLNFSGLNHWHLRLFKSKSVLCEKRLYDQHFISREEIFKIDTGFVHDKDIMNINEWKRKHKRWAKLESKDIYNKRGLENNFQKTHDPRYDFRKSKLSYYSLPKYFRAIIYFIYRYFFKLGFMDGKYGLLFCFYQALWFRLLIDYEINKLEKK